MADLATDLLHVRARGDAVRSLYRRGLTWVGFQPLAGRTSAIDFAIRKLPGLGLLSGTVQGIRHEYAREDVRSNDDFSIHINLSGSSIFAGRGREITLHDGDAVLLSYSESRTITRPGLVHHSIVRLPRASLSPLVRNIDDGVLRLIPRGTATLNLLATYIGAFADVPVIGKPVMRQMIIDQLCDLVSFSL